MTCPLLPGCCYLQVVFTAAVLVTFAAVAHAQGGCTISIAFNNDLRWASSFAHWDRTECPLT